MQWGYRLHHEYTLRVSAIIGYSFVNCDHVKEALPKLENLSKKWRKDEARQQKMTGHLMKNMTVAYNELELSGETIRLC